MIKTRKRNRLRCCRRHLKEVLNMLITILQLAGVLCSLAALLLLLRDGFAGKTAMLLLLAVFGCLIMNSGMLLTTLSVGHADGITAFEIIYLGGALFYTFFLLFITAHLQLRVPRTVKAFLTAVFGCAVAVCWTDSLRTPLMGQIWFSQHPVFHVQCPEVPQTAYRWILGGLLCTVLLGLCAVTVRRLLRTELRAERYHYARMTAVLLLLFVPLTVQLFSPPRLTMLPLITAVTMLLLAVSIRSDDFFNLSESAQKWILKQMKDAYVLADSRNRFLDCNEAAIALFPALAGMRQGMPLPKEIADLIEKRGSAGYEQGDRFYEVKITDLERGGRVTGHALLLDDDTDQQNYSQLLSRYNTELEAEVSRQTRHIQEVQDSIVTGMAAVIERRDDSTGGHIRRTKKVVRIFAERLRLNMEELKIDEAFIRNVIKAAPMHDIGKIAIEDSILRSPARLSDQEREIMKLHTEKGAELLTEILAESDDEGLRHTAVNVAHYHHERWDGAGYPDGISGSAIPLEARIMALADSFDAMVSKRCYQAEGRSCDEAFAIIAQELGKQFDPVLGAIFLQCRPQIATYYDSVVKKAQASGNADSH